MKILVSLLLVILFVGCEKSGKTFKRESVKGLSQTEADLRASFISDVSYNFSIDLSKANKSEIYTGVSVLNFKATKQNDLTIDFNDGKVLGLVVNNENVSEINYNKHFVSVPGNLLKIGQNTIAVSFEQKYSKTGSGLYRFQDKIDKSVYVYTDFEPYDANLFVPLLDQPNLKATYKLNVVTPDDWTVISSVRENRKAILEGGVKWFFPESSKFSTYIFSLHAGPYKVWRKNAKVKDRVIPMGLFARKSLAKFVKPDFWFTITEQGFNYFEDYFSTKYPYTKYDQVIVPDFNSGAMENVAAVTFNEAYVSRDKKPLRTQRERLANVIMHEMAHMWFGNLVTMDWWNDLWLNESFATYMANSATYNATEFKTAWQSFNGTKQWAYAEDQWRTTHPIEAEIPSTEVALTNFDGITYGKGASSLKQLVFLIGEDNFKKGLADYFSKFAEKNTKLTDFMGSLQKHTKENLSEWTKLWLQQEGLNSIKAKINCENNILKNLSFEQSFVSGKEITRPHKTRVALWINNKVNQDPDKVFDLKYSDKNTSWTPKEKLNCPAAVYPNWEDHDYVKVVLDEGSLKTFSKSLSSIKNAHLRSQLWSDLWSMVRFAQLKPETMNEIVKNQIARENDNIVLAKIVENLMGGSSYERLYFYYKDKDLAQKDRRSMTELLKKLIAQKTSTDNKKTLFMGWISLADTKSLASIESCLSKCDFNVGFELDQDRRWWLISKLAAHRSKNFENLMKKELERDSSRRGQLSSLGAQASFSKDKKKWLERVFTEESLALKERSTILWGVIPSSQRDEYLDLIDESFTKYSDKLDEVPARIQRNFAYRFAPLYCGDKKSSFSLSDNKIQKSNWSPGVKKALLQGLDLEARCLKVKNME